MEYESYATCRTLWGFLQNGFESSVWRRDEEIARRIHEGNLKHRCQDSIASLPRQDKT